MNFSKLLTNNKIKHSLNKFNVKLLNFSAIIIYLVLISNLFLLNTNC